MQHYVRRRAGPALPLYYESNDGYYSAKSKPRTKRPPMAVLACAAAAALMFLLMLVWLSTPIIKAYRTQRSVDHESERFFAAEDGSLRQFPSLLEDDASVTVSVVVPAYNEEERMPVAMDEMIAALKHLEAVETDDGSPNGAPFTWEILIVDDGSKDRTAAVAQGLVEREGSDRVRLLKQARNTGKGGAVRKGMLRTRGRYLLMADADGATRAADLGTLLARLRAHESAEGLGAAIGSRAHMTGAAAAPSPPSNGGAAEGDMGGVAAAAPARTVQRSALRRFLMWGFHTFVGLLAGGSGIKDTQCGFKLFSRPAARLLFPVQHIERWAFDVELVYLAARKGVPLVEVPVTWREMPGSKVDVASDSLQMARDIMVIRLCYATGIWRDTAPPAQAAASTDAAPAAGSKYSGSAADSKSEGSAAAAAAAARRRSVSGRATGAGGAAALGRANGQRGIAADAAGGTGGQESASDAGAAAAVDDSVLQRKRMPPGSGNAAGRGRPPLLAAADQDGDAALPDAAAPAAPAAADAVAAADVAGQGQGQGQAEPAAPAPAPAPEREFHFPNERPGPDVEDEDEEGAGQQL